jgi:hypothetical protein
MTRAPRRASGDAAARRRPRPLAGAPRHPRALAAPRLAGGIPA